MTCAAGSDPGRALAGKAASPAGAALFSRLLGFVRDLLIACALGAGPVADAFFAAMRIPNLMRRLYAENALTLALVPALARRFKRGPDQGFSLARACLAWVLIIGVPLCVLGLILAPAICYCLAPGFSANPDLFAQCVKLIRICLPFALFITATAVCMGVLNYLDRFTPPALAPAVLNICLISAALAALGLDLDVVIVLAWAVPAAGILQWLLQQPFLRARGFSWFGKWSLRDKDALAVGRATIPAVMGSALFQATVVIGGAMASFLPAGGVSSLYYADRLVQLPLGVFAASIGAAASAELSRAWTRTGRDEFNSCLGSSVRLSLFVSLPASAGLIALAEPIVSLLFGRGEFGPEAVKGAASALAAYSIGLAAFAAIRPLAASFHARNENRVPVLAASLGLAFFIPCALGLMRPLGHAGIALAASLAAWLNLGLLLFLHQRQTGGSLRALAGPRFLLPACILSALVGGAAWAALSSLGLSNMTACLGLVPVLALAYLAAARGLGLDEAAICLETLARFLKRR